MTKRHVSFLIAVFSVLAISGQTLAHPPNGQGLNTPSPDIPPIIVPGEYLSPQDVHAKYAAGALEIVLSLVEHQPFALLDPTLFECGQPGGSNCRENHHFDTDLDAMVSINGGPPQPIHMDGDVRTVAYGKGPGNPTGTFDTEMLQMNLVGPGGIRIRESPSRPSLGKTSIEDIGGGTYHIDSFFDVFTELSLDGGMTWIPKSGPRATRVFLEGVPEPASIALFGIGLLGVCGFARRPR